MKLRPYHNPEQVDESRVPAGWRFCYADEMPYPLNAAISVWLPWEGRFDGKTNYLGNDTTLTYIIPIA
jgi:hypothetical protein